MFSPFEKKDESYYSLLNKLFVGVVEDNKDDKRKGRVRVRVQGVFNDIQLDHIPWASPFRSLDGKSFCVPAIGKIVNVLFNGGDIYDPQYIYSENYNINLQNKLNNLNTDEYNNFVALLFDHRTQISADDTALTLDYTNNAIRIGKNSVDIKLKDNKQTLNLGHSICDQDAVLGSNFFKWMDGFMETLLTPTTLAGNLGAPILRPDLDSKILEYQQLRQTFTSNNVKIVDNGKITQDNYDTSRKTAPVKDDPSKINNVKLLEQKENPSPRKKDKEITKNGTEIGAINNDNVASEIVSNIKEERKKDTIEVVQTKPIINIVSIPEDENVIHPNYEDEDVDSVDEIQKSQEMEVEQTLNEDPYDFFADSTGRSADTFTDITNAEIPSPVYVDQYGSTTSGENGGISCNGGGNTDIAMAFLISKGWPKVHAAGIVGNLMVESGENLATNLEGDKHKPTASYGLAQWRESRIDKFQELYGKPLRGSSLTEQLEYINWELHNPYKKVGDKLSKTTTPEDAAEVIQAKYEVSVKTSLPQRQNYAKLLFNSESICKSTPKTDVGSATHVNVPHTKYNQLMELAADFARKFKLDPKVNYDNLILGFDKNKHGLCPQGTCAVLAALVNDSKAKVLGHANFFSFSPTNGRKSSFVKTGYYNDAIKINYEDYYKDKTKWQLGDIIALDYVKKPYGHIQIWTGICWQSDFKQNQLHKGTGDVKYMDGSVALWRMNDKGLTAAKNNLNNIA